MSSIQKNVAGQHIGFVLNSIAAGTPVTAGGAGTVVIDGGAQASCAGTFTHKGTGQWDYAPTQAETNGTQISFAFTGTGAIQIGMTIYTIGYNPTLASLPGNVIQWAGATALLDANNLPKVDMEAVNGDLNSAANVQNAMASVGVGTIGNGSSTTSIISSAFSPSGATANQFVGRTMIFNSDTITPALRGQATSVTASSNLSTPIFTVVALTTAPVNGDTFTIV